MFVYSLLFLVLLRYIVLEYTPYFPNRGYTLLFLLVAVLVYERTRSLGMALALSVLVLLGRVVYRACMHPEMIEDNTGVPNTLMFIFGIWALDIIVPITGKP